jgi:hypothetical protein
MLVPVWGYGYVRQFLDYSLPTLLAPGNIPAVAEAMPCTFVLLTSANDAEFIVGHPGYRLLSSICSTEIALIDDLITGDNYSTTITLAYERAVRMTGAEMLDTCFFFLISDYLVADGSLRNALTRIAAGASGILAGNFQIVQEDAAPEFYAKFERDTPEITIAPRQLMRWALSHLHPMTAANTVNFPLSHTSHTNRLFWRVDRDTLIGRFYLMHMICIRPEITDFVIGSSCDYSFISEMCPSGAVEVLTDSDEYLVVEMQPRGHERNFLRMGPFDPEQLAEVLSEWTTARHRENVRSTLVFHGGDAPATLPKVVDQADRFIETVTAKLNPVPQPHRDHPYWLGAIAAHRWALNRLGRVPGTTASSSSAAVQPAWSLTRLVRECRVRLFGRPPDLRPWHPRWPDYRTLWARLQAVLSGKSGTLLIVAQNAMYLKDWMSRFAPDAEVLQTPELLNLEPRPYGELINKFHGCIAVVDENELRYCRDLLDRLLPLVVEDGFVMLATIDSRLNQFDERFAAEFAYWSTQFLAFQECLVSTEFVPITKARARGLRWLMKLNRLVTNHPVLAPVLALPVVLAAVATYAANQLAKDLQPTHEGACSSALMVFRPSRWSARPEFKKEEIGYWARKKVYVQVPKGRIAAAQDV